MSNRIKFCALLPFSTALALFANLPMAHATSVQAHGQVGLVGEYFNPITPGGSIAQTWRAPMGLTLEIRPTNNLATFFDLRLGYNHYPQLARDLGNDQNNNAANAPLPFTVNGGRGERADIARVGFAYVEYSAPELGLFRVGRVPRNWGLGLWRNDGGVSPAASNRTWLAEGGTFSTTDGISATIDFRNINFSLHWEKTAEGMPTSASDDADAWTADIVVGDHPTEVGQSGFGREVGIAFSKFSDNFSDTKISTLDLYSRLQYESLLSEIELLYPSGSTGSAQYSDLGTSAACSTNAYKAQNNLLCSSQRIDAVAALFRFNYQFYSSGIATTSSTNEIIAKRGTPTLRRRESHTTGLWLGYTSGDSDAFTQGVNGGGSKATMGVMHPNIRPSLLMFNSSKPDVTGMPGAIVRNTFFARGEYVYEAPTAGTFTPAIIWGLLNETRPADTGLSLANTKGVGRYSDLGYEFNISYSYTTSDYVKLDANMGMLLPGKAWAKEGASTPDYCLGGRIGISTTFH